MMAAATRNENCRIGNWKLGMEWGAAMEGMAPRQGSGMDVVSAEAAAAAALSETAGTTVGLLASSSCTQ